ASGGPAGGIFKIDSSGNVTAGGTINFGGLGTGLVHSTNGALSSSLLSNSDLAANTSLTNLTTVGTLSGLAVSSSNSAAITGTSTSGALIVTANSLTGLGNSAMQLYYTNANTGAATAADGLVISENAAATPSNGTNVSNDLFVEGTGTGTVNGIYLD